MHVGFRTKSVVGAAVFVVLVLKLSVAGAATSWTDPTITDSATPIRAVHINELRTAIANVRSRLGMTVAAWTDPTLAAGATIRGVHVRELRTRLQEIMTQLGSMPAVSWTDPSIVDTSTKVRGVHIREVRQLVNNAENSSGCSGYGCFIPRNAMLSRYLVDLAHVTMYHGYPGVGVQAWATNCSDGRTIDTRAGGYPWIYGQYSGSDATWSDFNIWYSQQNGWLQQFNVYTDPGCAGGVCDPSAFCVLENGWNKAACYNQGSPMTCDLTVNWTQPIPVPAPANPFCSGDTCFVSRGQLITSDLRTYARSKYNTKPNAQAWATNCDDAQTYDTRSGGYTWLTGRYADANGTLWYSPANGWLQQVNNSDTDNTIYLLINGWTRFKAFTVNTNSACDLRINWQ